MDEGELLKQVEDFKKRMDNDIECLNIKSKPSRRNRWKQALTLLFSTDFTWISLFGMVLICLVFWGLSIMMMDIEELKIFSRTEILVFKYTPILAGITTCILVIGINTKRFIFFLK